ncbi:hypothetical protein M9Y10_034997 [Tritrichomonas musculus]|uniref:Uncharacterized protein n=1 Tax=Tritrichomonas musculus TaxID=1915356 RepID=A0ABR2KJN9_9EUKA
MVIIDYLSDEDIEHAFDSYTAFKPILPMEMRDICTCSIVKGKDHEYLYIMPSQMKDSASIGKVDIIDPMTGKS